MSERTQEDTARGSMDLAAELRWLRHLERCAECRGNSGLCWKGSRLHGAARSQPAAPAQANDCAKWGCDGDHKRLAHDPVTGELVGSDN